MGSNEKEKISIINGPNINILGIREPNVYGKESWSDIEEEINQLGNELGISLSFFQSNHEGEIVDYIQKSLEKLDGVIINPAAFTRGGYSILDVLTACDLPFVEVHLSNIFARGGWHAESIFSSKAIGHISGFQGNVYTLGLQALCDYLRRNNINKSR